MAIMIITILIMSIMHTVNPPIKIFIYTSNHLHQIHRNEAHLEHQFQELMPFAPQKNYQIKRLTTFNMFLSPLMDIQNGLCYKFSTRLKQIFQLLHQLRINNLTHTHTHTHTHTQTHTHICLSSHTKEYKVNTRENILNVK